MIYDIEAPDGRIFSIEGDEPPTAQDVELLFSSSVGLDEGFETATEPRPDLSQHDIYDTLKSGPNIVEKLSMVFRDKEASFVEKFRDLQVIAAQSAPKLNFTEHGKSGGRGIGYLVSNAGKLLKMSGEQTSALPFSPTQLAGINIPKKDFGNLLFSVGDLLDKGGEAISDSKILQMDEEYKKEVHSGTFIENPSFARIVDTFMESAPSMGVGYGIGALTKSSKLAALALSFVDSSYKYVAHKDNKAMMNGKVKK